MHSSDSLQPTLLDLSSAEWAGWLAALLAALVLVLAVVVLVLVAVLRARQLAAADWQVSIPR